MAKTPIEFFQLFFTGDLISKILDEPNKYGLQKLSSQCKNWWIIRILEDFFYLVTQSIRANECIRLGGESLMSFQRNLANCLLKSYGTESIKRKIIQNPVNDVRYDSCNRWPYYVNTERLYRFCGGKSKFICSKSKVGLHPK